MPGDASVALSEIMAAVGLTGVPTAVEVSDSALFSASDETGEWVVTARRAFSTTEWMTVAIDGIEYKITVTDDQSIDYLKADGTTGNKPCTIIDSNNKPVTWDGGWYAVTNNTTIDSRVTVNGTVNLILCNNATLTAEKGITVAKGATLNIYAQSTITNTMGALTSTGDDNCAGIGGGFMGAGGDIAIRGGEVTAIGGEYNNEFAGGIGAGRAYTGSAATTIKLTPNGGEPVVKANVYLGTLTLGGDFCEKLSDGSYGAVIDAEKDPTPVSDEVKAILAGRTIAAVNGTIYKISSTFIPNEPAGNRLDVTVNGIPVTRALAGTSLTLAVEGDPVRFALSGAAYGGNTVIVPKNGVFTMPDADVEVALTQWAWLQQQIDAAANTANSAAITLPCA